MDKTPPPAKLKRSGKKGPGGPAPRDRDLKGGVRGGDPDAARRPDENKEPPIIERNVT